MTINKAGNDYDAQRDGEPAVYVIDPLPSTTYKSRYRGSSLPPSQRPKSDNVGQALPPVHAHMNGLLTDLYELTMAAGYFAAGKHDRDRNLRALHPPPAAPPATSCWPPACTGPSTIC